MIEPTDHELLARFARNGDEAAFAALVARHVNLVYSAALRFSGDCHHAEEITQAVFIILSRKAGGISAKAVLSGWLYQTARLTAANFMKELRRRQIREHEVYMQSTLNQADPAESWKEIAPVLDGAMNSLREADRDAVLLRFFENKTLADVGAALGVSEDAARVRVNRALEKLHRLLSKQGVTLGATVLAAALAANAVQAAPAGLAAAISTATLAGTTSAISSAVAASTHLTAKTILMTTIQKTILTLTITVLAGAGVYEAVQSSRLREQNQQQQQAQDALAAQLQQLQEENTKLAGQNAEAGARQNLAEAQLNELQKARGQASQARKAVEEMQQMQLPANSQPQTTETRPNMSGMISMSYQMRKGEQQEKLNRMATALNLSDAQKQAIAAIMNKRMDSDFQSFSNVLSGSRSVADLAKMHNSDQKADDSEIKALLSPAQMSAYQELQDNEALDNAKSRVANMMKIEGMELTQDQQDRIRLAYMQNTLPSASPDPQASNTEEAYVSAEKQALDARLKVLQNIMTPEQLLLYQQHEQKLMDRGIQMFRMLSPQNPTK
jgi:RNA polymerase sigma factor (sigma-70 family)